MESSPFGEVRRVLILHKKDLAAAFLLLLVSNLLLITNPLLLRRALEGLLGKGAFPVATLLAVAFTSSMLRFFMRIRLFSISCSAEKQIRGALFYRLENQSAEFYSKYSVGDLVNRLTSDIIAWRDILGPGVMYPLFAFTLLVPGFLALGYLSLTVALVAAIPLIILPILNRFVRKSLYETALSVQRLLGNMSSFAEEIFSSIGVVKAYCLEKWAFHKYEELSLLMKKRGFLLSVYQGLLFPLFALVARLVTLSIVALFSWLILVKKAPIDVADFVSFMWIQSYLFLPLLMLGWVLPIYQKGRAAYFRLHELWQEPFIALKKGRDIFKVPPEIRLEKVFFRYPGKKEDALRGVSLRIPQGAFVGLTGEVGAGKTTLFRLLLGELGTRYRGSLLFDGNEMRDFPPGALQKSITSVEQIPFLFSNSIRENILFGNEEASDEEMEAAADMAAFHDAVSGFPGKYETLVGEKGTALSGGEKQRLAMARAFLFDRSLLLLDDIFSSLDTMSERNVLDRMKRFFIGKTVVVITHRPAVLKAMDWIVVMAKGKVIQEGTPAELGL